MGDLCLKLNEPPIEDDFKCFILLTKDRKTICRTQCLNQPIEMPPVLDICDIVRKNTIHFLSGLPQCFLRPASQNFQQGREWEVFLGFLENNNKVAIAKVGCYEFYIVPPREDSKFSHAVVLYRREKKHQIKSSVHNVSSLDTCAKLEPSSVVQNSTSERNYVRADPSYLKTLGQAHSSWIFGAIAELVDNSRDAKATMLEISIDMMYSKNAGKEIPMLSVIDDGHGMTHQEIVRMTMFGHKQPDADDPDHIGRFGIGFKNDSKGRVWVHSNKQGFQDCEAYALLEEWLSNKSDIYLDKYIDKIQLKKGNALYKPDHEWVQCDRCRKWRMLTPGFDSKTLPQEWFCLMKPFCGRCEMHEQKVGRGVITISAKRSQCDSKENPLEFKNGLLHKASCKSEGSRDDDSSRHVVEDTKPSLKRFKRGPRRDCRKY